MDQVLVDLRLEALSNIGDIMDVRMAMQDDSLKWSRMEEVHCSKQPFRYRDEYLTLKNSRILRLQHEYDQAQPCIHVWLSGIGVTSQPQDPGFEPQFSSQVRGQPHCLHSVIKAGGSRVLLW